MPHTQQTDAQFPPENVEATTERPIYPTAPFRVCFALSNTAFTEVTVTCVNQRMWLHYDVTIGDACITAPFPSVRFMGSPVRTHVEWYVQYIRSKIKTQRQLDSSLLYLIHIVALSLTDLH